MSAANNEIAYAELHCVSCFSFLRGASHADELMRRAHALGYTALAITDECSVAGVVRAYQAAKECGIALIVGAEFHLEDGPSFVLLAPDREAYAEVSRLITRARQHAPKGQYRLSRAQCDALTHCLALWLPSPASTADDGRWLAARTAQAWLGVALHREPDDAALLAARQALAAEAGLRCVAIGSVLFDTPQTQPLHDVMSAIRLGKPVAECGTALLPNAEAHLRERETLARRYPAAMLAETVEIASRCQFDLKALRYEYPSELVPEAQTPTTHLRALTEAGLRERWPQGEPAKVRDSIEKELTLIAELKYEAFFLTVHDVVREARARGILCQGRGSAANSAVCFALGVTSVNPAEQDLLFERFLSRERDEPPDIDVDFEHQRRKEIIQYVFDKYGRHRSALAATVITYRSRSALRDVGRALGMEEEDIGRVAKTLAWWDDPAGLSERLRAEGFDPEAPQMRHWILFTRALVGYPRHLSQHVGGFVISQRPLDELVPIENASMPGRQVIQWDKDDLEALGLLKVDVLALGMLTAIRRCFDLVEAFRGRRWTLATLPQGDARVYDMICEARTIGVFQIESRAQQSMLPRLKPREFYDLVVQIAIVRPGPITGGMVHPYLRRREGKEAIDYPPALEQVLGRTKGVPIFQEQVMQIAVEAAGFTPGEADQMRRSMAAWKRTGGLEKYRDKLIKGMTGKGHSPEFAEQIYQRILGFGSYGFPESHSASFALLAYASSWLKHHECAAFMAALINSQPMGFYPPSMLVQEAQRSGVEVRAVDVIASGWFCSLEPDAKGEPALRLGLLQVQGLSQQAGEAIEQARRESVFSSIDDLARRARLGRRELSALADAGALTSLAGHRHAARWNVAAHESADGLALDRSAEPAADLRAPNPGEDLLADYRNTGLSLRTHPLALLRERLAARRVSTNASLLDESRPDRSRVRVSGMVMFRQRPGSAKGVMFMTLEDETGTVNLILRPRFIENHRAPILGARLAVATGQLQRSGSIVHVTVERFDDITHWMGELPHLSRDFH